MARVADQTKSNDLDGAAQALDDALLELDRRQAEQREAARRRRVVILEAAVKQHMLLRGAVAVATRVEMIVAVNGAGNRPAWQPEFRQRYDKFWADGETKGVNFSLLVAIELARRMVVTGEDMNERGTGLLLLGNALARLGERESGTARLLTAAVAVPNSVGTRGQGVPSRHQEGRHG